MHYMLIWERNVEYAFIVGISVLGLISLGMGFIRNQVGLFILRALSGACKSFLASPFFINNNNNASILL